MDEDGSAIHQPDYEEYEERFFDYLANQGML